MKYTMDINEPYSETNLIEICPYCGSKNFSKYIIDQDESCVCEYEVRCKNCDELINYWSYGWSSNDLINSDVYLRMTRKLKLSRVLA